MLLVGPLNMDLGPIKSSRETPGRILTPPLQQSPAHAIGEAASARLEVVIAVRSISDLGKPPRGQGMHGGGSAETRGEVAS